MDAEGALSKLDLQLQEDLEADRRREAAAAEEASREAEAAVALETPIEQPMPPPEPEVAESIEPPAPEPANDWAQSPVDELPRLYADQHGPTSVDPMGPSFLKPVYRVADLANLGPRIESARFYDASYRATLAAMVAHVLAVEGPIFDDLLVRRIARAHGLQRAGHLIREAVLEQVDVAIARTDEAGRTVLWPAGTMPADSFSYRAAEPGIRSHVDTPMPELIGLATTLESNASEADRVRAMASRLGLSRIEASARTRLERASVLARSSVQTDT